MLETIYGSHKLYVLMSFLGLIRNIVANNNMHIMVTQWHNINALEKHYYGPIWTITGHVYIVEKAVRWHQTVSIMFTFFIMRFCDREFEPLSSLI